MPITASHPQKWPKMNVEVARRWNTPNNVQNNTHIGLIIVVACFYRAQNCSDMRYMGCSFPFIIHRWHVFPRIHFTTKKKTTSYFRLAQKTQKPTHKPSWKIKWTPYGKHGKQCAWFLNVKTKYPFSWCYDPFRVEWDKYSPQGHGSILSNSKNI